MPLHLEDLDVEGRYYYYYYYYYKYHSKSERNRVAGCGLNYVCQDRKRQRAVVNTVMNLWVQQKVGVF
jgi:hypothetical protein